MSFSVSELIKAKEEEAVTEEGKIKTKSRDEWKKEKELEEARKAGTAPAAVDEEGRDINPHIPQYISSAPWYYSSKGPTLKHQRVQEDKVKEISTLNEWYARGVDTTKISTKFRKGACENCGAMTHKKKDCLERPRKIGVKYTGTGFAPDEHAQPSLKLDFDGKRDRWNGYDPNEYLTIVSEFQKVEEAKRHLKAEKLKKGIEEGDLPDNMVLDEDVPEEDEDKYVEDADMPGTKVDSKQRITVRNLRIREDTAKYLRNLDPESAFYDPKTRAMRDNPYKNTGKSAEEVDYAGENFIRYTGDTNKHAKAQLFAWEAQHRGVDIDLMAEPTKLEILKKEFEKKKDEFKGALTESVIEKYGGKEHLEAPPRSLLLAQTEDYIEYSRQGKIIKGGEKQIIRSKYEEDVYPNNHSSIFGSFWREGHWGYNCCHSLIRNSYCTGDAGKEINDTSESLELAQQEQENRQSKALLEIQMQNKEDQDNDEDDEPIKEKSLSKSQKRNLKRKEAQNKKLDNKKKKRRGNESSSSSSSSSSGSSSSSSSSSSESEDEEEVKKKKLKKALAEEERRHKEADHLADDRNRKYNSRYDIKAPTEEETEAYLMMRQREDDPMAHFK